MGCLQNKSPLLRIGYLVPEFPAQTHIFFWREISALRELGVDVVLISTRPPPKGGISHSWADSAMRATYYILSKNPIEWLATLGFILQRIGSLGGTFYRIIRNREYVGLSGRIYLMVAAVVAARLSRFARSQQLNHIHVGSCGRSAEIAALGYLFGGFTFSLSMLGPSFSNYGGRQRFKWRNAAFGIFQSKMLVEEGRIRLGSDFPKKYAHAPVGVDTERMQRSEVYQPWSEGSICRIYSCGRLDPVKGHEDVIDAVCQLRVRGIDARLVIGGEDNLGGFGYRANIQEHIARRGAVEFVQLLGAVSEEINRQQYQSAHVYVMGSHNEAAGAVAAMEAMSMATPVVMCRAGATEELISNGVDGLLTEPRTPAELSIAIERVLRDSELANRIRTAGREKILAMYSHFVSAQAIRNFLEELNSSR